MRCLSMTQAANELKDAGSVRKLNAMIDVHANFADPIDKLTLETPWNISAGDVILKAMNSNAKNVIIRIAQMSILEKRIQ